VENDHDFSSFFPSATDSDPSPCNASVDSYSRRACTESLYYPSQRRLSDMYDEAEGSLSAEEEEEDQDRSLATAKYTAIPPFFSPSQGYLNFEVAIEKSDSGKHLRLPQYYTATYTLKSPQQKQSEVHFQLLSLRFHLQYRSLNNPFSPN
jgi:hypothetical protein